MPEFKTLSFKSIKLKNFRCLEDFSFSFEPNRMVLFVGNNGTGKTSVFSALFWALYGETLDGSSGDDDVVNKRKNKDTCVSVVFSLDDDIYEVVAYRKDSKYGNSRFIFKNGKDITPVKDIFSFISNLVMEKDLFYNCLMFSNFSKFKFTDLSPSEKVEFLEKLLGLSEYEVYRVRVKELIVKKKNDVMMFQENINFYKNNLDNNSKIIEGKKEEIERIKRDKIERLEKINSSIKSLEEELAGLNDYVDKNKSVLVEYNKVRDELSGVEALLNSLKSSYNEKEYEKELKRKYNNLFLEYKDKELASFNESIRKLDLEIGVLNSNLDNLVEKSVSEVKLLSSNIRNRYNSRSLELVKSISDLEGKIILLQKEMDNNKNKIDFLLDRRRSIEKDLSKIKDGLLKPVSICGICGSRINESNRKRVEESCKKMENEILSIDKEIEGLNLIISDIKDKLKLHSSKLKKLKLDKEELENECELKIKEESDELVNKVYSKKIQDLKNKISELQNHRTELEVQVKKMEESKKSELYKSFLSELESVKAREREKIDSYVSKKNELESVLRNLELSVSELDKVKEKINYTKERMSSLLAEKVMLEKNSDGMISNIESDIKTLSDENEVILGKIKDLEDKISNSNFEIDVLNFWDKGFSSAGIRNIVLDEVIPFINKRMRIMELPIRVSFSTTSSTKKGELRNKFNIDALHTKNLSGFKEFSSGERRLVDILCMFGIRELLEYRRGIRFNLYLLDEVLDSLDEDNIDIVTRFLRDISNDKTVIIISHTLRGRNFETDGFCDVYRFS